MNDHEEAPLPEQATGSKPQGRITELKAALQQIAELTRPEEVCCNCKYCEEIAGDDYCRFKPVPLEDSTSQGCGKFEAYVLPPVYEIACKALKRKKNEDHT